jgi:hypothetical protein
MKKFVIFKLSTSLKASVASPIFISASTHYNTGGVNVTVAHDLLFDTEAEAELKIQKLPSPALYVIMPCYVNMQTFYTVSGSPYNYSEKDVRNTKVPIKRGCPNKECFCTGKCNEIIGWRDKLPNEF